MKKLYDWWLRTVLRTDSTRSGTDIKRQRYLMGKCIGCGRCDSGQCPVKVKRKEQQFGNKEQLRDAPGANDE